MTSPALSVDNVSSTKDKDWVRASFMLAVNRWNPDKGQIQKENKEWLYFTTASYKVGNTSLGGNNTINNLAQYTLSCDLPRGGLAADKTFRSTGVLDASMVGGMGRYYSEAIDDWSMKVSFRFGVPEYKGLITFFTSFYDGGAAMLGRQGRMSRGLFYTGAKVIGSLIALPLTVMVWVGEAMQWMANRPSSRYYNLKPAMALYWQRVNLIANMMAANMGLIPADPGHRPDPQDKSLTGLDPRFDPNNSYSKDAMQKGAYGYDEFNKAYPQMFMKYGGIDIYTIANKFNRMHFERTEQIKRMMENNSDIWQRDIKKQLDQVIGRFDYSDPQVPGEALDNYLEKYHQTRLGFAEINDGGELTGNDAVARRIAEGIQNGVAGEGQTSVNTIDQTADSQLSEGSAVEGTFPAEGEVDINEQIGNELVSDSADDAYIFPILKESSKDASGNSVFEKIGNYADEWIAHSKEFARDGGQWINFRVDTVKTVDESFTNNVGPSEIQGKVNGMSSTASGVRFGLSDFKTGFGTLDSIVQTVRDTFTGVADGLHIGGLAALMGSGFVDIPQRWMDSAHQMPTSSYTIKCRPPYGNIMSRFLNMHVPIACLLAGTLPVSYGRHSYGSPMICEMYVQGKNQSRLAMITSLSISRGEGNLGWSKDGAFLGCDISFEVTDFSTIMHAPIDTGMQQLGNFRWLMSDDNVFNDYMAVLSNMSINEMTYSWEKLKLNWRRYKVTQQNFASPARVAMVASDTGLGRMIRKFTPGQDQSTK